MNGELEMAVSGWRSKAEVVHLPALSFADWLS
jgi:hypothetical protein